MTDIYENYQTPSQFLVDNIDLLPKGKVLDIAMGAGRNTVYLARTGFEVDGVDISQEAIAAALESAKKASVVIKAQVADLEKTFHIRGDSYNVIVCFNYLQRSLIPEMKNGLRRGGMIVYETYIIDQVQFGKPKNPNYLLKHNELLDIFRDLRCLRYREGVLDGPRAVASIIAQKA
ncbi:class I SAM-dependent methyltransferase [Chloroflexota bacterium]